MRVCTPGFVLGNLKCVPWRVVVLDVVSIIWLLLSRHFMCYYRSKLVPRRAAVYTIVDCLGTLAHAAMAMVSLCYAHEKDLGYILACALVLHRISLAYAHAKSKTVLWPSRTESEIKTHKA